MPTGIEELDEQIAFWAKKPEAMEQAVTTAFFVGMTLGVKMAREQRPTPTLRQRKAPGTKSDRDVDTAPDCVLHDHAYARD